MTFNQVISRIRKIASSHKQVRTFKRGKLEDFLSDKTSKYVAVFLQENTGSVSMTTKEASFSFRMFVLDLTHVSEETDENELDVLSDTYSIILDILAQMNWAGYDDWRVSANNNTQSLVEYDNDMTAGWYVDISISIIYSQNICAVPTGLILTEDEDMKPTYDTVYTADGTEGNTIYPPEIAGMKLLLVIYENNPLYRTSTVDDTVPITNTQYSPTQNGTGIRTGIEMQPGDRTLILYRKF